MKWRRKIPLLEALLSVMAEGVSNSPREDQRATKPDQLPMWPLNLAKEYAVPKNHRKLFSCLDSQLPFCFWIFDHHAKYK